MSRYAILETNTGYVWGVETAASPIDACRQLDRSIGEHGLTYEEAPAGALYTTEGLYDVRVAPDGFDVVDGQDRAAIADVNAMPTAALVRSYSDE